MELSDTFDFTLRGQPAKMVVMRNSGMCWGRIFSDGRTPEDIAVNKDWYDYPDAEAAQALIRAARRRKQLPRPSH